MENGKDQALLARSQEEAANEEEVLGSGRGERKSEEKEELKPWEQHSAVISIPRYNYKAPSSLLERSHSGFLITCPIKREKSATKEAISILEKFASSMCSNSCTGSESCNTNTAMKKRKLVSVVTDIQEIESAERDGGEDSLETGGKVAGEVSSEAAENVNSSPLLSLVKLTGSGLVLFTFPTNDFHHVVGVLSDILVALDTCNLKRPLWCNRIFPIQETCILSEKNLEIAVSKLLQEYMASKQENLERPIKFAVGYNRRGIEDTEMKSSKSTAACKISAWLDRESCFKIVAGAFKDVAKNSIVDLRSPEVAVLVELLPLSGVPHESVVVGVSILPFELITTKPRLCVKPLVSDRKPTKKRD